MQYHQFINALHPAMDTPYVPLFPPKKNLYAVALRTWSEFIVNFQTQSIVLYTNVTAQNFKQVL